MLTTRYLIPAVTALACLLGGSVAHASPGSTSSTDYLGRPTPQVISQAQQISQQPWVPQQIRTLLTAAAAFYQDPVDIEAAGLVKDGPRIAQFWWPSVAGSCIDGTHASTGTAIAVPGPSEIPLPGAQTGETVFLFTALGTGPAAPTQDMRVHWVNARTGAHGVTALANTGVNPQGPATISATAATGTGTILAVIEGAVRTTTPSTCTFVPTAAVFEVK